MEEWEQGVYSMIGGTEVHGACEEVLQVDAQIDTWTFCTMGVMHIAIRMGRDVEGRAV